jgi:hypothetical protein
LQRAAQAIDSGAAAKLLEGLAEFGRTQARPIDAERVSAP